MRHFVGWEIFCHRLPKLTKLTIVFIGDECPTGQFPKDFTYKSKDVQQVLMRLIGIVDCSRKGVIPMSLKFTFTKIEFGE